MSAPRRVGRQAIFGVARELARGLVELALLAEVSAVDYARDTVSNGSGGHGKHGTTSTPPPRNDSLYLEWLERLERLSAALVRDLEDARTGQGRTARRDRGRKKRIARDYAGRSPEWVGFVEGVTAAYVEKCRHEDRSPAAPAGREKKYGHPLPSARPLTDRAASAQVAANIETEESA